MPLRIEAGLETRLGRPDAATPSPPQGKNEVIGIPASTQAVGTWNLRGLWYMGARQRHYRVDAWIDSCAATSGMRKVTMTNGQDECILHATAGPISSFWPLVACHCFSPSRS